MQSIEKEENAKSIEENEQSIEKDTQSNILNTEEVIIDFEEGKRCEPNSLTINYTKRVLIVESNDIDAFSM